MILKTENLSKKFGQKHVVNQVNMQIEKGDIYGFIGKNGAGKTTFMRLILGLAYPTDGNIELFGSSDLPKQRHRIGSLIESPNFYKNCSAYENMKRFSLLYGTKDTEIDRLLKMVGLDGVGSKKVSNFSLGMKQRLGLAMALLGDPEFVVLDEPVNGLDPVGMKEIRDIIQQLNQEKGITFLISSHLLDELSKIATKYGIINDGRLVEEVSASDIRKKCTQMLKISTTDTTRAMECISYHFADAKIIIENQHIVLLNHVDGGAEINQLLLNNGISVIGLELISNDLENYFIQKIGE